MSRRDGYMRAIKPEKGRVLSFTQKGDFFLRLGMDRQDENRLPDAMAYYRKALALDPDNPEIMLAMAEAYTAMCRYSESNSILLSMITDDKLFDTECLFGLACNCVGMAEYDRARDYLDDYLDSDPDGEFYDDALDILDAIDTYEEQQPVLEDADAVRLDELYQKSRACIDKADYKHAVPILKQMLKIKPDSVYIRNNLALALYCLKRYDEVKAEVKEIFRQCPRDVQAHCTLAICSRETGDKRTLAREAKYLRTVECQTSDELNRLTVTLMELQFYAEAEAATKKLLTEAPYDREIIHRYAVALYEQGQYQKAAACYDDLIKVDPMDSIAQFYRRVCLESARTHTRRKGLLIAYQVPHDELLSRMKRISQYVMTPREELIAKWQDGDELETLIRWAMGLPETAVKRAMLSLVSAIGDAKAESLLRELLLDEYQPDELKRDIFMLLKDMGASEPYTAIMNGRFVESRVTKASAALNKDGMPASYIAVLERALSCMQGERSDRAVQSAVDIWTKYVSGLNSLPAINRHQVDALAAALEYVACSATGDRAVKTDICRKYDVTLRRFDNAMNKLNT